MTSELWEGRGRRREVGEAVGGCFLFPVWPQNLNTQRKPPFLLNSSLWIFFFPIQGLYRLCQFPSLSLWVWVWKLWPQTPVSWRGSWLCAVITVKAACWSRPLVDTKLGDVAPLTSLTQNPGEQGGEQRGRKTLSRRKSVKGARGGYFYFTRRWVNSFEFFFNGPLCTRYIEGALQRWQGVVTSSTQSATRLSQAIASLSSRLKFTSRPVVRLVHTVCWRRENGCVLHIDATSTNSSSTMSQGWNQPRPPSSVLTVLC